MMGDRTVKASTVAPGSILRDLVAVSLGVLLVSCTPPSEPEEEVRQWVRAGHQAAEEKDRRALIDMISPAYSDARGNDRDSVEDLMRLYFLRQQKVALITKIEELSILADTAAEVVMTVAMAGTNDNALGFSADVYRFELELERADDDWQLIAARWGPLGQDMR